MGLLIPSSAIALIALLTGGGLPSVGSEIALTAYIIDNLFLLIAAILVISMQAGFAAVESGIGPTNNTINIMFKNFTDLCAGALLYYAIGYGIMYGADASGGLGLFGWGGFGVETTLSESPGPGVIHPQLAWLFQVAFAATAATIVSGAVVGRMKFSAYVVYSIIITGLIYPISGFWKWGGGWLDQLGFYDFAGSVVVHAVGGFAALAAAIVLGPRLGRFGHDHKEAEHLRGHSLATASLGVFLLWVGWYGFNPGSQLAFHGVANIDAIMLIAVNTTLAGAAGALSAMITTNLHEHTHKAKLSMLLNGALAGLVGITAGCDSVTNFEAIIIGVIAGILVVYGNIFLLRMKIDDAVGAWPVHGLCGVWGGIAVGIFGPVGLGIQVLGSVVISAWAFGTMLGLFMVLKRFNYLRVSHEDEVRGLDTSEHGEIEGA